MIKSIVLRAGGYFVTGESWSGPWKTLAAAQFAIEGLWEKAHEADRISKDDRQ